MSKKILIVDDSQTTRMVIKSRLAVSDFTVVEAEDGEEGLALAKTEQPDLILLDVMMPGLNGLEVCKRIKADPELKKIPIFFISVKAEEKDIKAGLAVGANGYITKPYEGSELIDTINKALS